MHGWGGSLCVFLLLYLAVIEFLPSPLLPGANLSLRMRTATVVDVDAAPVLSVDVTASVGYHLFLSFLFCSFSSPGQCNPDWNFLLFFFLCSIFFFPGFSAIVVILMLCFLCGFLLWVVYLLWDRIIILLVGNHTVKESHFYRDGDFVARQKKKKNSKTFVFTFCFESIKFVEHFDRKSIILVN